MEKAVWTLAKSIESAHLKAPSRNDSNTWVEGPDGSADLRQDLQTHDLSNITNDPYRGECALRSLFARGVRQDATSHVTAACMI